MAISFPTMPNSNRFDGAADRENGLVARRVRPRLLPTLVTVVAVTVFVWAGNWQRGRMHEKEALVEELARAVAAGVRGARFDVSIEESYRNMKEVLDGYPEVVEYAFEAVRRAGLEVTSHSIRGGTDGSRLSFMGLPTPNIFAGEHNFHSRLEWVSAQDMEKAVEVIVHLCRVWEERSRSPTNELERV